MPKMKGPILSDIAKRASVSSATVDRVINRRPGVRELTAKRVLQAAADLGYVPQTDIVNALRPRPMRLVFLLPAGTNSYLKLLGETVKRFAAGPADANATIRCFFIDSFDPKILAEALRRYGDKIDGVAFMAIDHPLVREAVTNLRAKGKHVITLISDVSNSGRSAYVGLDNRAVGRTAAYVLGRLSKIECGKVALIAATRTYRAHEEREMGFLGLMEQSYPQLTVIGLREGHDDRSENYRLTLKLLDEYPDLVGIYNVGGSSDGIARALRERGRERSTLFIGHGLTSDTRGYLLEDVMDVVITQSPDAILRNAMQIFINLHFNPGNRTIAPRLPMEVIFKENLP